jgi:hypothetical protein
MLVALMTGVGRRGATQSGPYKPVSPRERELFERASRTVYPADVLQNPERYGDSLLVWAAVIDSGQNVQSPSGLAVFLFASHRFFDWIEDRGPQRESFFLSPRGEGTLLLALPAADTLERAMLGRQYPPKTMIVAYGYPRIVERPEIRIIHLLVTYVQPHPPAAYRQDVLDYGRPGEPIRFLRAP